MVSSRGGQAPAQAPGQQQAQHADQAGTEVRGIDQTVRHQKAHVLRACVYLGRGPGEQQHHPGQKYQNRQDRRGQPGSGLDSLLREQQAPGFVGQQQHAGQQQW